jgi:hypothetical protein
MFTVSSAKRISNNSEHEVSYPSSSRLLLPLWYCQAHPGEVCSRRAQTHMHALHGPATNGTRMHALVQREQRQVARQNEAASPRLAVHLPVCQAF